MTQNVLNAFMAGRQVRKDREDREQVQQERQNALGLANTQGKIQNALMNGDRAGAQQMAQRSADAPTMVGLQEQLAGMDEQQRDAAASNLRASAGLAIELLSVPEPQRQGWLQQRAPVLQSMGIDPTSLQGFGLDDASVRQFIGTARALDEDVFGELVTPQTLGANDTRVDPITRQQTVGQAGVEQRGIAQQNANTAQMRASQPRGPLVNVQNGSVADPFGAALRADDAERALGVRASAQAAQDTIYNLDILQDTLLDPTVYTGAGAQLTLPLRRAAEQFGMDAGNVSASEVATRVATEMALALKDRLPGPMSDGDRQFLMSIPPNLGNTKEGNAALIFMTRRRAQYEQRMAASMDAALGPNPTGEAYRAWEQQQRDVARTQPLYTEDDRRAVQLLLGGAEFRRSGNDIYVIDGDEAIRLGD